MIREVNSTQVAPDEQLSDFPYQFDSKNHILMRMDRLEERKKEIESVTEKPSVIDKINQNIEKIKEQDNNTKDVPKKSKDTMAI